MKLKAPKLKCIECDKLMKIITQDQRKSGWDLEYKCNCGSHATVLLNNDGKYDYYIYNKHNVMKHYGHEKLKKG